MISKAPDNCCPLIAIVRTSPADIGPKCSTPATGYPRELSSHPYSDFLRKRGLYALSARARPSMDVMTTPRGNQRGGRYGFSEPEDSCDHAD